MYYVITNCEVSIQVFKARICVFLILFSLKHVITSLIFGSCVCVQEIISEAGKHIE